MYPSGRSALFIRTPRNAAVEAPRDRASGRRNRRDRSKSPRRKIWNEPKRTGRSAQPPRPVATMRRSPALLPMAATATSAVNDGINRRSGSSLTRPGTLPLSRVTATACGLSRSATPAPRLRRKKRRTLLRAALMTPQGAAKKASVARMTGAVTNWTPRIIGMARPSASPLSEATAAVCGLSRTTPQSRKQPRRNPTPFSLAARTVSTFRATLPARRPGSKDSDGRRSAGGCGLSRNARTHPRRTCGRRQTSGRQRSAPPKPESGSVPACGLRLRPKRAISPPTP